MLFFRQPVHGEQTPQALACGCLENNAIQIGIISQLEYFLKSGGHITEQKQIAKVIMTSSLEQLEKENLMFLFLVRHTLVHNGGHYDDKFIKDCKKHFKTLKIEGVKEGLLSSLHPADLPVYIKIVKKLIDSLC